MQKITPGSQLIFTLPDKKDQPPKQPKAEQQGWFDWAKHAIDKVKDGAIDYLAWWQASPSRKLYDSNCAYLNKITKKDDQKATLIDLSKTLTDQIWENFIVKKAPKGLLKQEQIIRLGIESMFVHGLAEMAKNSGIKEETPSEQIVSKIAAHLIGTMLNKINFSQVHKNYMKLSIALLDCKNPDYAKVIEDFKKNPPIICEEAIKHVLKNDHHGRFKKTFTDDLWSTDKKEFNKDELARRIKSTDDIELLNTLAEAHLKYFFTDMADTLLVQAFPGRAEDEGFINIVKNLLGNTFLVWLIRQVKEIPNVSWEGITSLIGHQLYDFFITAEKGLQSKAPTLDQNPQLKKLLEEVLQDGFNELKAGAKNLYKENIENPSQSSIFVQMPGADKKVNQLLSDTMKSLLTKGVKPDQAQVASLVDFTEGYVRKVVFKLTDHLLTPTVEGQTAEEKAVQLVADVFNEIESKVEDLEDKAADRKAIFNKLSEKLLNKHIGEDFFHDMTPKVAKRLGLWKVIIDVVAVQLENAYQTFYHAAKARPLEADEKTTKGLFHVILELIRESISKEDAELTISPIVNRLIQTYIGTKEAPEGVDAEGVKKAIFGKEGCADIAFHQMAIELTKQDHLIHDQALMGKCFLQGLDIVSKRLMKEPIQDVDGVNFDNREAFYDKVSEEIAELLFPDNKTVPVQKALQGPTKTALKKAIAKGLQSAMEPIEDPIRRNGFILERLINSNNVVRKKLGKQESKIPTVLIKKLKDKDCDNKTFSLVEKRLIKELGSTASLRFRLSAHSGIRRLFGRKRGINRFFGGFSQILASPFIAIAAVAIGSISKRASKKVVKNILNHPRLDNRLVRVILWETLTALKTGKTSDGEINNLKGRAEIDKKYRELIARLARDHKVTTVKRFPYADKILGSLLGNFTNKPPIPFFYGLLKNEEETEAVWKSPLYRIKSVFKA